TYESVLVLVNPTDRTRVIDFGLTVGVEVSGRYRFVMSGLPLADPRQGEFEVEKPPAPPGAVTPTPHAQRREFTGVELPPGRTLVRVRCIPPPWFLPADHRKLCYFAQDFRITGTRDRP
ncbi:MAG: hypothetical protein K2V38_22735, partial [Gemmataceae bacterium]|nr:hypothetical protein [Gemmataceae bacterium]